MLLRIVKAYLFGGILVFGLGACGDGSALLKSTTPTQSPTTQSPKPTPPLPTHSTARVTSSEPTELGYLEFTPKPVAKPTQSSTERSTEIRTPTTLPNRETSKNPDVAATLPPTSASAMEQTKIPNSAPPSLAETGTNVGNRIPDFELVLLDGSTVASGDLVQRRKPAFLFFHAVW